LILKGIMAQSVTEYPQKYPQNRSLPASVPGVAAKFPIIRVIGNFILGKTNIRKSIMYQAAACPANANDSYLYIRFS
jgi:hypothetical protein